MSELLPQLLEVLVPAAAVLIAAVFAFAWRNARKLVAETENKWDDALLDAFDEGYTAGREAEKAAKPE